MVAGDDGSGRRPALDEELIRGEDQLLDRGLRVNGARAFDELDLAPAGARQRGVRPFGEIALRILRARLLAAAQETADAEASEARRSQVRTVDRSERIRTYNYPENRISDHRVGYKAYNLSAVLDGDLDDVLAALAAAERAESVGA